MLSHALLKCVVWHFCPAGSQHGHEALQASTRIGQPVSTRKALDGLELPARSGAEEGEAPRLRSRQLVLEVPIGAQHLEREIVHLFEGFVRV